MSASFNEHDIDWDRLGRYLARESSATEAAEVEAWLAADPARRDMLESLRSAWETAGRPPAPMTNVDGAWVRMSRAVDAHEARRVRTLHPRVGSLLRVAAAIVILAGAAVVWRETRPSTPPPPRISSGQNYITAPGAQRSITLPDGSQVLLGVASQLRFTSAYGAPIREVALDGEAFFRVRHDAAHPFRVWTAAVVIEDLGTEFTVRAYDTAPTARVVVTSGSVSVHRGTDSVVARAGEEVLVGAAIRAQPTDSVAALAWTRGQLVFHNATLQQVADELKHWYGVDVRITTPALAARHITTTFTGEPIDQVLTVIATQVSGRFERDGNVVTLREAGAPK
jgi:transmembrane sensor